MLALELAHTSRATPPEAGTLGELRGLPASGGAIRARPGWCQPSDFGRLQAGDVLVALITGPQYNVVLPLIGAAVTERAASLSHARPAGLLVPDGFAPLDRAGRTHLGRARA